MEAIKNETSEFCTNVFKSGDTHPSKKDYTDAWVRLINQSEKDEANSADIAENKD